MRNRVLRIGPDALMWNVWEFGRVPAVFCCAVRFLAAFAPFNHDDPVALHGAGRTAGEADDIIGSAAAARTRDDRAVEATIHSQWL